MDTHDTPDTPDPARMRAEVWAYIETLDTEALEALWRMFRTALGPVPWPWEERDEGGEEAP
jgi:hypothetical protein